MKKFQKNKEDFICLNCNKTIKGDGYTNHCPSCLWSRHVDINPGDRQSKCRGMMKPVNLEIKNRGPHIIYHVCLKCGHTKPNKTKEGDRLEIFFNEPE